MSIPNRSTSKRARRPTLAMVIACLATAPHVRSANADPAPAPSTVVAGGMVHPGIFYTEVDLERVRSNVAAGREPWKSAWDAVRRSGPSASAQANVKDAGTNAYAIQNDGHAAYLLAVKWVATGDPAFAAAAERLIDRWTEVDPIAPNTIRTGIGSTQMANAAEILAHGFHGSAGWPPDHVVRAQRWFRDVVYPHVSTGNMRSANWGTASMAGCMCISIFCDDRRMYRDSIDAFEHGFTNTTDGECGVTQYVDPSGEDAESGRDQPHSQGGIAHLMEVAVAALNQGDPGPFAYGHHRIVDAFEYTARYNLGQDVPYHPFATATGKVIYPGGISGKGRGEFSPVYTMASFFFARAGVDAPFTRQVTLRPGYAPEPTNSDHVGLGTLMFSVDPK